MEENSSLTPLPSTEPSKGLFSLRHQKYFGLASVILAQVLIFLGLRTDFSSIAWVGWILGGVGLALYARGGGRSIFLGLIIGLGFPIIVPLISLIVFARNRKIDPETGKSEERSLTFVVIVTLIWTMLDALLFGSGVIAVALCVVGVLYLLPRAIAARKDVKLFRLRLTKAVITSVAGFVALGMVIHVREVASERAGRIIVAVEQFQTKYGRYPEQLEDVVPEFIPSIPDPNYVLASGRYRYIASDSHILMYTVIPPFGRRIYTFETHKWSTLD